jgi:hypothetical protein
MGMDPGLSLRIDETGTPLYARLDLRMGSCLTRRLHLGADWRMDTLVAGGDRPFQKRHELGPVLTYFLLEGWFFRTFIHIGGLEPFFITAGIQSGYEFSAGKFAGIGLALGGDLDIPFDGQPPQGYSISAIIYLTAYDLMNRRNRDK